MVPMPSASARVDISAVRSSPSVGVPLIVTEPVGSALSAYRLSRCSKIKPFTYFFSRAVGVGRPVEQSLEKVHFYLFV